MEEQDIPYNVSRLIRASLQQDIPVENVSNKRQGLGYPKPHSRMPIRSYDAHDENKLVNHRQTLRPTTRTSTEPGLSNKQNTMSSDVYTSFYGVKFKIAERDKDGNPSGIADAAGRVWHKGPNGKFVQWMKPGMIIKYINNN
jgi:hypothetical protein